MAGMCVGGIGVGEKEGEEAAEAAAPLISSFLNTFRLWCQTDSLRRHRQPGGPQVGSPRPGRTGDCARGPWALCMWKGSPRQGWDAGQVM